MAINCQIDLFDLIYSEIYTNDIFARLSHPKVNPNYLHIC